MSTEAEDVECQLREMEKKAADRGDLHSDGARLPGLLQEGGFRV